MDRLLLEYEEIKLFNSNARFEPITYDIGFKCICFSTLMDCYRKQKNLSDRDYFFFKKSLCDIDSSKCHDAAYDARVQGIMFTKLIKLMNISF